MKFPYLTLLILVVKLGTVSGQDNADGLQDVCEDDVCFTTDLKYTNEVTKCPIGQVKSEQPTCDITDVPRNDTCFEDDEAEYKENMVCHAPISRPLLCRILGNGTSCSWCLIPIQLGSCGGLFTFSLFAITRSGLTAVQPSSSNLYQDTEFVTSGNILTQMFLLKELVTGAISTFVVVINVLVHFDRRRFIQNRELRQRLRQLLLHIYHTHRHIFNNIRMLRIFFQDICGTVCASFYNIIQGIRNDIIVQLILGCLGTIFRYSTLLVGLLPHCGCVRWNLRRSVQVQDERENTCCYPNDLKRSTEVDNSHASWVTLYS